MEEQRARMEARRKRLKEEVEKAKAKKVKKAVTRDISKDQSRKTVNRLTGGNTPKTGESAKQTLSKFAGKKPASAPKAKPAPAPKAKPATAPAPKAKPATASAPKAKPAPKPKSKASDKAVEGGYTVSSKNRASKQMPSNPKLKSQVPIRGREKIAAEVKAASGGRKQQSKDKPKNPKKGQTYTTWTGTTMVWTGKNWKQKTK